MFGHRHGAVEDLGKGYSEKELQRTFRNHVKDVEDEIVRKAGDVAAMDTKQYRFVVAGGDPLKELQLADAVLHKMKNIKSQFVKEHQVFYYIRDSLQVFYTYLATEYSGRFPNEVRAMWQAVNAAISCSAPDGSLAAISRAVGASPAGLAEGRKHWMAWINGDREAVMDLRGINAPIA